MGHAHQKNDFGNTSNQQAGYTMLSFPLNLLKSLPLIKDQKENCKHKVTKMHRKQLIRWTKQNRRTSPISKRGSVNTKKKYYIYVFSGLA